MKDSIQATFYCSARSTSCRRRQVDHCRTAWRRLRPTRCSRLYACSRQKPHLAFRPWPGAFTQIGGQNLKIFSATVVDSSGGPGEISARDKQLIIASGKGALTLN